MPHSGMWDWAKDDDIGEVNPIGVAFAFTEGQHDRIFVAIEDMVTLEDGDYQIEVPVKIRGGSIDTRGFLSWDDSRWIQDNTFHEDENGALQLDYSLDLILVRCGDAQSQLRDPPMMHGTQPDLLRELTEWEIRSRGRAQVGVYGYNVARSDAAHILAVFARNPVRDDWVQLGQINLGVGKPAPSSRTVVAVCLTPFSLALEPVYYWFWLASHLGG